MRNGKGRYTYKSGAYYDGEWADDQKNGKGIFDWNDGSKYEGSWLNNQRNGRGTYIYADGDYYYGDWKTICKMAKVCTNSVMEMSMKDNMLWENAQAKAYFVLPTEIRM